MVPRVRLSQINVDYNEANNPVAQAAQDFVAIKCQLNLPLTKTEHLATVICPRCLHITGNAD